MPSVWTEIRESTDTDRIEVYPWISLRAPAIFPAISFHIPYPISISISISYMCPHCIIPAPTLASFSRNAASNKCMQAESNKSEVVNLIASIRLPLSLPAISFFFCLIPPVLRGGNQNKSYQIRLCQIFPAKLRLNVYWEGLTWCTTGELLCKIDFVDLGIFNDYSWTMYSVTYLLRSAQFVPSPIQRGTSLASASASASAVLSLVHPNM